MMGTHERWDDIPSNEKRCNLEGEVAHQNEVVSKDE